MADISELVQEIERHKGVLLPDSKDLEKFAAEIFCGAMEFLKVPLKEYKHKVAWFVEQKYKEVLLYTKAAYEEHPTAREFPYKCDWDDIETYQLKLADFYREQYKDYERRKHGSKKDTKTSDNDSSGLRPPPPPLAN